MAQLYCIENKLNGKRYYGIVIKEGKTIQERFIEHSIGNGGIYIYDAMLKDGVSNFNIDLIHESDNEKLISEMETEYILNDNTIIPNGYNGNYGGYARNVDHSTIIKEYNKTEQYKEGRKKLSIRKLSGKLTKREIKHYKELPSKIKNHWDNQTEDYIMNRTKAGLDAMNSVYECEYCGKKTNKGNYTRWHGDRCKYK